MALPSALQTVALTQLEAQFWSLVDSMHTWFQSNPTANAATALAYLEGLADPAPNDDVKIVDRTALFNWLADRVHPYEGKATAYLSLRQLLLDHPKAFIRSLDNDLGRSVTSRAQGLYHRIRSFPRWSDETITDVVQTKTRDAAKGNYVSSETISANINGVSRTIQRTFTITSTPDGGWSSTANAWTVV